jgi:hypothetical protein
MGAEQRREFQEALLDADSFEDLPGKWQAAIVGGGAEPARPSDRQKRLSAGPLGPRPCNRFSRDAALAPMRIGRTEGAARSAGGSVCGAR